MEKGKDRWDGIKSETVEVAKGCGHPHPIKNKKYLGIYLWQAGS